MLSALVNTRPDDFGLSVGDFDGAIRYVKNLRKQLV